jgi:nucleotide-binding universal stress UspA family protein
MAETERILVPTDGSPLSYRALRHALGRYPDAEIVVYHVVDLFEPDGDGDPLEQSMPGSDEWQTARENATEALLDEATEIAREAGREVTTESAVGDPQRLIPEYAREAGVDHIVMGVHGRDDETRELFGRVAEAVVYRAPVPVTVYRSPATESDP